MAAAANSNELTLIVKQIVSIKEAMQINLDNPEGQRLEKSPGIAGIRPSSYKEKVEDALKIAKEEELNILGRDEPNMQRARDALKSAQQAQIDLKNLVEAKEMQEALFAKRQEGFSKLSAPAATVSPKVSLAPKPAPAAPAAAAVSGPDTKDLLSAYTEYLKGMKGSEADKANWKQKAEGTPPTLSFPDKASADAFLETQAKAGKNFIAIHLGADGKPTGEFSLGADSKLTPGKMDPKLMERVNNGLKHPICDAGFLEDVTKAMQSGSEKEVNQGVSTAINAFNDRIDAVNASRAGKGAESPTVPLESLGGGAGKGSSDDAQSDLKL